MHESLDDHLIQEHNPYRRSLTRKAVRLLIFSGMLFGTMVGMFIVGVSTESEQNQTFLGILGLVGLLWVLTSVTGFFISVGALLKREPFLIKYLPFVVNLIFIGFLTFGIWVNIQEFNRAL
ncbi:MAG: hypothetical protein ACFB10_03095 [Salibacteraceae bacterium]